MTGLLVSSCRIPPPFQTYDSKRETPFRHVSRVCLHGISSLDSRSTHSKLCCSRRQSGNHISISLEHKVSVQFTFPPRTSSPMIKQAAVWIVRALRSSAVAAILRPTRPDVTERWLPRAMMGDRCRDICDSRENMRARTKGKVEQGGEMSDFGDSSRCEPDEFV